MFIFLLMYNSSEGCVNILDTGASRSTVPALISIVVKRTLSSLTRDERYKKIVQGMQATIVTLNRCAAMVALLKNASGPYADRVQKIEQYFV